MLNWFKFLHTQAQASLNTPVIKEEIPHYPPFLRGLPAAPVDAILHTQSFLIHEIRDTLALPEQLYREIVSPVILNYAAYSHLLPASEHHHHRGAGGLLRHGLEVARLATLASKQQLYAIEMTPRERKHLETCWRVAVMLGGLLHDIGKPVSDLSVVDRNGQFEWHPCLESIPEWAERCHISHYYLRWREHRYRRHELFSILVLDRVLTQQTRHYLLMQGPAVMHGLLGYLAGLDSDSELARLVKQADEYSLKQDLKAYHPDSQQSLGVPVERYLLDAMRRLIRTGRWQLNTPGHVLWQLEEGVFIHWQRGALDILELLNRDDLPGIPNHADTLADILIEKGVASACLRSEHNLSRYWYVHPYVLNEGSSMLRLSSHISLFDSEPGRPAQGRVATEKPAEPKPLTDIGQQEADASGCDLDSENPASPATAETTVAPEVSVQTEPVSGRDLFQPIADRRSQLTALPVITPIGWLLPYPELPIQLGIDPSQWVSQLAGKDFIQTEVLHPLLKVRTIGSLRGIVLTQAAGQLLESLLQEGSDIPVTPSLPTTESSLQVLLQAHLKKPASSLKGPEWIEIPDSLIKDLSSTLPDMNRTRLSRTLLKLPSVRLNNHRLEFYCQ